jgi:site-specific recombinase XerD
MSTFNRRKDSSKIYLFHYEKGERWKASTGIKVEEKDWDTDNNKPKSSKLVVDGKNVADHLAQWQVWLAQALQDLRDNGGDLNSDLTRLYNVRKVGQRVVRGSGRVKFLEYFKEQYEKKEATDTSTWKHYRTTYRMLEEFFGNKNPSFEAIDSDFYDDFGSWMRATKKLATNTISGHWKRIKTILRLAHDKGLHKNTAYTKFVRHSEASDKIALTEIELHKLAYAVLPEKEDLARDLFLVSCYIGHRISDWSQLKDSAIQNNIFTYTTEKSPISCSVPIKPIVRAILNKYSGSMPVIPANQNQPLNEDIREACRLSGITDTYDPRITKGGKTIRKGDTPRYKLISSHSGRRTFATQCVLKSIPVHLIMMMTGHQKLETFDKYVKLKDLQGKMELGKLVYFKI